MRVFTIPASRPFITTLLSALVEGRLIDGFDARRDPQALADATIYLPTQRAARMARTAFLEVLGTDAVLLPHQPRPARQAHLIRRQRSAA